MGDCSFIVDNKTFHLSQGNIPLYNQITNEKITYKLNNTFYPLKLEKQINKEKKLIRRGRTKGLIKEHEVKTCFHSSFVITVGFILNGLVSPWLGLKLL